MDNYGRISIMMGHTGNTSSHLCLYIFCVKFVFLKKQLYTASVISGKKTSVCFLVKEEKEEEENHMFL